MNETADNTADSGRAEQATSLGEMIRAARELREIAIEELAQRLRLEPRKLRQLEQDQFDHVGPPAYVRGYLRSIAKELDVDASALLDAYAQRGASEPPPLVDFSSRPPVQISSDSQIIRYTTATLVVVMLVLVVMWWRTQVDEAQVTAPVAAVIDEMTEALPAAPLDVETIARDEFDLVLESGIGDATVAAVAGAPESGVAAEAAAADAGVAAQAPTAELVLSASADAWVEIRDAGQSRLYYGTLREGQTVDLAGVAPYSLVIGNAAAVTLRYAGDLVDLAPHSEEGVARLSLDVPAPASP